MPRNGKGKIVMKDCFFPLTLGELKKLVPNDGDRRITSSIASLGIGEIHSWRGSYNYAAIEIISDYFDLDEDLYGYTIIKNCAHFHDELDKALSGTAYSGWKGGEFIFDENTPVFYAQESNGHDTNAIVQVHNYMGATVLYIRKINYQLWCSMSNEKFVYDEEYKMELYKPQPFDDILKKSIYE